VKLSSYGFEYEELPPRLSNEDEREILARFFTSREESDRNLLVEHNLRLVLHIAKKYSGLGYDLKDIVSNGVFGLIKGVNTFKADKGTKLASYVGRCIENEILMHLRDHRKHAGVFSTDQEALVTQKKPGEGEQLSKMDMITSDQNIWGEPYADTIDYIPDADFAQRLVADMKETLPPRAFKVFLNMVDFSDEHQKLNQREMAATLGISRSYVSRIEASIKRYISAKYGQNLEPLEHVQYKASSQPLKTETLQDETIQNQNTQYSDSISSSSWIANYSQELCGDDQDHLDLYPYYSAQEIQQMDDDYHLYYADFPPNGYNDESNQESESQVGFN